MHCFRPLPFSAILAVFVSLASWAQLTGAPGERRLAAGSTATDETGFPDIAHITSSVNEVQLSFTALHRGRFVTDLQQGDLKLLDDKVPPSRIGSFWKNQDLALKIAFLVDASGSVEKAFRTEQRSAIRFLDKLLHREGDRAAILSFSAEPQMERDFTADRKELSNAIKDLHATQGGTAIYDAMLYACDQLRSGADSGVARKAIVLITDGDDNASHAQLVDGIRRAQQNDIIVYVVQVNSAIFGKNSKPYTGMQTLAAQTGGQMFQADGDFSPAFKRIEEELRSQYVVTYTPAAWENDGRFRKITLHALRSGIRIRCRPGYYAAIRAENNQ